MTPLPQGIRLFHNALSGTYTCLLDKNGRRKAYEFPFPGRASSTPSLTLIAEGDKAVYAQVWGPELPHLGAHEGPVMNTLITILNMNAGAAEDAGIPYANAVLVAEQLRFKLDPVCVYAEIAGSIRRQKKVVKDIEIVVVPKQALGLGNDYSYAPYEGFCEVVNSWQRQKGEPTGRYTQRIIPIEGHPNLKLDLFIACPANLGLIMIYRTGSAEFNKKWLGHAENMGFRMKDGFIWRDTERIDVRSEAAFFELMRLQYLEPYERNADCKLRYI